MRNNYMKSYVNEIEAKQMALAYRNGIGRINANGTIIEFGVGPKSTPVFNKLFRNFIALDVEKKEVDEGIDFRVYDGSKEELHKILTSIKLNSILNDDELSVSAITLGLPNYSQEIASGLMNILGKEEINIVATSPGVDNPGPYKLDKTVKIEDKELCFYILEST